MKKNYTLYAGMLLTLLAMVLTACATQTNAPELIEPVPTGDATELIVLPRAEVAALEQDTYADPFAYCAAVGTIDAPDARYSGPHISDEIINGFINAAHLEASTAPLEMFATTTIWRCMDGLVYTCNFGANLPCSSKANTDRTPTLAMENYCQANPEAEFIPMSVTGHSTIYSWHCVKDTPELLNQIENVDAAGYLANIWYPIDPNASPRAEIEVTQTPIPAEGDQILFASNRGGYYSDLYLLDLNSRQLTRLTNGDSNTFPGPFSPDNNQILFTGYGLIHSYVGLMNANGTEPQDISQSSDSDEGFPTWSPDGQWIAFTSRRDGNNEIYMMKTDGTQLTRLTDHPGDDFAPAWSPDGTQIAFVSDRDNDPGVNNLYIMNADGSNVRRLTNSSENDYSPAWSPDGAWIAFRAHHDAPADIYLIHPDGTGLVNLTNDPADDWAPAWSPDGTRLAFQTNRDGNWEIYICLADGSNPLNLTQDPADDEMPYWK